MGHTPFTPSLPLHSSTTHPTAQINTCPILPTLYPSNITPRTILHSLLPELWPPALPAYYPFSSNFEFFSFLAGFLPSTVILYYIRGVSWCVLLHLSIYTSSTSISQSSPLPVPHIFSAPTFPHLQYIYLFYLLFRPYVHSPHPLSSSCTACITSIYYIAAWSLLGHNKFN